MNHWIYFATAEKASLAATVETVINAHFLWRTALNEKGAQIANVGAIRPGDRIVVAWRHSGSRRTAYLQCTVARPFSPLVSGLVIDTLTGPDARLLTSAGYKENAHKEVEGIRLANVSECHFTVRGTYGGNNAIHKLAPEDLLQLSTGSTIPPGALNKVPELPPKITFASSATDHLTIHALTTNRAFDAYAMIDWSSSSSAVTGNDSIWIGKGEWSGGTFIAGPPVNVPTRVQAIEILYGQLLRWRSEGKRVLAGFDFAFGYPAGFAQALGLPSADPPWKAVQRYISANVKDSSQNVHNRDAFAEDCNRRIGAPGPFWGCASSAVTSALTQQRVGVFQFPHHNLGEWRVTDFAAKRRATVQSVWKLNCGVSVGGQTILGIKHLDELARAVDGQRWPFEGWCTPPTGPAITFAEIFPSLVQYPEWTKEYETRRDRTQVQSCIRYAAERDSRGALKADFARPATLNPATLCRVESEEGWILWVREPRITPN